MKKIKFTDVTGRASWGSIFGGVITVLGISILLAMLGSSIGFFMFDPTDSSPMSGIGTTMGIWTVLAFLISIACGGFVAGKLAGVDGMIHGFLVWALTLIVTVIMGIMLAAGAVKATANVLGSVASVTGSVLSGVGSAVGSGVSAMSNDGENLLDIDFDTDGNELRQDIRQTLRRTGVRELQPEYMRSQLRAVKNDLRRSAKRLAANPQHADQIIDDFTGRLETRANQYAQNINREEIVTAITNTTSLSRAEAENTVDQYMELIEQGKEQIANLQETVRQAKAEWENMKQNALEEANKAANAAGRAALWSFIAMLIGAGLCAFMGYLGARKTKEGYDA